MTNFIGAPCSVCKESFTKDDHPVVCPDCGAPYHRDCYKIKNRCEYSDMHSSAFVWKNVHASPPENPRPQRPEDFDLLEEIIKKVTAQNSVNTDDLTPDERFLFGVSEKELTHFQGGLSPLRLLRYRRIASGRKISLNLFAAFFSPLYMFYTRMRLAGAALMLFTFFVLLPSVRLPELAISQEAALLFLGLHVLIALFYDYIYLRWSAYKIKLIRSRLFPHALNDRPEIPDMPSVSAKLQGLDDDYYRFLQAVGAPSFRYMLFDGLSAFVLINFIFMNFGGSA
jgi:hypothetical protein